MCVSCGCGQANDDHGDARNLTMDRINQAGEAAGISGQQVAQNIQDAVMDGESNRMASEGVPIIHLLNIKGLAARYNLPWDPQPLPQPGENLRLKAEDAAGQKTWLLVAVYLLVCAAMMVMFIRPTQRKDA